MADTRARTSKQAIVEEFREALDARDFERAFRHTVAEPVWRVFASEYKGRDGIERVMGYSDQLYQRDTLHKEIQSVTADDERVVVRNIMRGKTKTGRDYENYYVLVYEFDDDKIAVIWEYLDKDYTNRIFDDIQLVR
jgi:ketosteroid isomerase-like protein